MAGYNTMPLAQGGGGMATMNGAAGGMMPSRIRPMVQTQQPGMPPRNGMAQGAGGIMPMNGGPQVMQMNGGMSPVPAGAQSFGGPMQPQVGMAQPSMGPQPMNPTIPQQPMQPTMPTQPYTNAAPTNPAYNPTGSMPMDPTKQAKFAEMANRQMPGFGPDGRYDPALMYEHMYGANWRDDPGRVQQFAQAQSMAGMNDKWAAEKQAQRDAAKQQGGMQMGQSGGGSFGNPTLSPTQINPYLDTQAQSITNDVNKNLSQQLLANSSNQVAAGGFGSRGALMAGQAMGDAASALTSGLGNLRFGAFENQANRDMSKYQGDQTYALGNRNADLGFLNSDRNYTLGQGNLALGNKQADNSYALGQGQLGLGYFNGQNSYNLGQQQNANTASRNANDYSLGQGQLGLGYTQANNNFNLGNRQIDSSFALGNRGYDLQDRSQMLNFAGDQRAQDRADLLAGASIYGQGVNGAWDPLTRYSGLLAPYASQNSNSTTSTPSTGGGWQGLLAGLLGGAQLGSNLQRIP